MNFVSDDIPTVKLADVAAKVLFTFNGQVCVKKGTGSRHVGGGEVEFDCFCLSSCTDLALKGNVDVEHHPAASIDLKRKK